MIKILIGASIVIIIIAILLVFINPTPTVSPVSTQEPDPYEEVILDNLPAESSVTSPLTISGTVPPGWMFEASFPITVLDENRNIITQGYGEPIPPANWMSDEPVRFSATLSFETDAESGYIRFEKDNPSGLPENADSQEIPVNFN